MFATVRLMNDDTAGPVATIYLPDDSQDAQEAAALTWAEGQTGWPWDTLTITPDDDANLAAWELNLADFQTMPRTA